MEWVKWSNRLKRLFNLKGSPVAVRFSLEPRKGAAKGKFMACRALKLARDGKIINLTKENSLCGGGTTYLGLSEPPKGDEQRWLQKFLVHGEKLFSSYAVFHRAKQSGTRPLTGLADNVIFCPLEKAKEEPDIVILLANAEVACRLLQLATYWDGVAPKTLQIGSGCQMAVSYPINSGEVNVSFMDWTARKMIKLAPDELLISIPFRKMHGIMEAISACSAGTAKTVMPPEIQEMMKE